jgi:predicted nucleic acid-binding Zn ribbon protein
VERVGNLLGQIANLKSRSAGRSESSGSVSDNMGRTTVSLASQGESRPNEREATEERRGGDIPDYRARQYQLRRRRAGVATDLTKIKGILSKALAHKGLDKGIERYEFILHWEEIVGESLARISKPECILNRALIVRVVHSTWAQELAFMKPVLIQKVLPYLKKGDTIDDIVFRIGSMS